MSNSIRATPASAGAAFFVPIEEVRWWSKDSRRFEHRALESEFRRRLRQVAQEIRRMTAAGQRETTVIDQLRQYGRLIGPWSRTVTENIVLKANRMNLREWNTMDTPMRG